MRLSERAWLRRRAGLTQVQLARMVGVSASQICLWERGDADLATLDVEKIAQAFETELNRVRIPQTRGEITSVLVGAHA